MITKIYSGKDDCGKAYYQGLMMITKGELKNTWTPITQKFRFKEYAIMQLDCFIESTK